MSFVQAGAIEDFTWAIDRGMMARRWQPGDEFRWWDHNTRTTRICKVVEVKHLVDGAGFACHLRLRQTGQRPGYSADSLKLSMLPTKYDPVLDSL